MQRNRFLGDLGGDCPRLFTLSGRIGQTIYHLMQAKRQGITSLENTRQFGQTCIALGGWGTATGNARDWSV